MDRPEQADRGEPPSIFTKPDPLDEKMPAVAPPVVPLRVTYDWRSPVIFDLP